MCHHHHHLPLHHHSQLHSPRNSILLGLLFPLTRPLATSACPCHVYTMRCPSISSIHPSIHSTLNTFFPSILTSSYPPPLLQKKRAVQEYPPYHQTTLSPRLHETPQNLITILLQLILAPITLLFLFWLSLATHSFIQIFSHHKLRATLVRLILRVSESVPSSSFFQFSDITLSLE